MNRIGIRIAVLAMKLEALFMEKSGRVRPFMIYCDDCLLIFDLGDWEEINEILNECGRWANESESIWEVNKCHVVLESQEVLQQLTLQGEELQRSTEEKYLGLQITAHGIDLKKNLDKRILAAENQLEQVTKTGILARRILLANRVKIYRTFVRPHLEYALIALDFNEQ